ncbi:MAG TPA: dihydrofolate reductase family protein [Miltoncostaeaceae bacterium]|nr:dihydrofolate reductase family protein [Miltoncostaeaceae bacterium]
MRQVVATLLASLDGYARLRPDEEMRRVDDAFGEDMTAAGLRGLREVDTLLFGRVTYQMMAGYWPTAGPEGGDVAGIMNGIAKVVFSTTLRDEDVTWSNARLAKRDLEAEVRDLKAQAGRDIGVVGSVELLRGLITLGPLDRLRLLIHPVILGDSGGTPIFGRGATVDLALADTAVLDGRVVLLEYGLPVDGR